MKRILAALGLLTSIGTANAAVFVSSDINDFSAFGLTQIAFPTVFLGSASPITSLDSTTTLTSVSTGNPPTGTHGYEPWISAWAGNEYVLNGDENFDVTFTTARSVFAMDYWDDSIASTFDLDFLSGGTVVETAQFTTSAPFSQEKFIGFLTDASFDAVRVREDDGANNTNEYFRFYAPTSVPEPVTLMLLGAALAGMGATRRR